MGTIVDPLVQLPFTRKISMLRHKGESRSTTPFRATFITTNQTWRLHQWQGRYNSTFHDYYGTYESHIIIHYSVIILPVGGVVSARPCQLQRSYHLNNNVVESENDPWFCCCCLSISPYSLLLFAKQRLWEVVSFIWAIIRTYRRKPQLLKLHFLMFRAFLFGASIIDPSKLDLRQNKPKRFWG